MARFEKFRYSFKLNPPYFPRHYNPRHNFPTLLFIVLSNANHAGRRVMTREYTHVKPRILLMVLRIRPNKRSQYLKQVTDPFAQDYNIYCRCSYRQIQLHPYTVISALLQSGLLQHSDYCNNLSLKSFLPRF